MSNKAEMLEKMRDAVIDLDDDLLFELIDEGLKMEISPLEMIIEGMNPGLNVIGEGFDVGKRFMSDLIIAGDMLNDATDKLRPLIEAGGKPMGETMIIGTVEGDVHFIGKRIVGAVFTANGYNVIDIGENKSAKEFAEAAKKHNATVVGASAILSPVKAYCGNVNKALVDIGVRDNLIYIVGGWAFTDEQAEEYGADAAGISAIEAIKKVKMLKSGAMPMLKNR
ncbi:MAG: cobalamin-dependent protein [Proteobacteria bacterium]|nr:cobalamin-dependent protein [Pseudomonadota bacterium]